MTTADGGMYRGEFLKGHKSGQGEEVRADGTSYVGKWKKGKPDGRGEEK